MRSRYIGLCFLVCLALSMSFTYAEQMGIGVEPTIVDVYLDNNNDMTVLPIRVSNPSEQDMIFRFSIDAELEDYIQQDCVNYYYWCDEDEYFVPADTDLRDGTVVNILFVKQNDETAEFEAGIYVQGRPTELPEGMIIVTPRIMIRTTVHQMATTTTTTTTLPPADDGNSGSATVVITPETTTTTLMPDDTSDAVIIINPDRTTTTIEGSIPFEEKEEEVGENSLLIWILIAVVLVVAGGLGIYYFKEKMVWVLPFLLIYSMMPMGYAYDVGMDVNVTVTTTTLPPPPIEPYQLAVPLISIVLITGFIFWTARSIAVTDWEMLVSVMITVVVITAVLLGVVGVI